MTSLILQTAARALEPLLLLLSLFMLIAGHNQPGGGFVGGLIAASAFSLHALAFGVADARDLLKIDPRTLVGTGLLLAMAAALGPTLLDLPLLTGVWGTMSFPGLGALDVGTPLLFDAGVYLLVMGVTLLMILTLAEE